MKTFCKPFIFVAVLALPWSLANASFCTTYFADHGAGVCVNLTAPASSATGNNPLSASAVLEVSSSGTALDVTIVNDVTGVTNQIGGSNILDAFLFNITNSSGGALSLTPGSASLTPVLTTTPDPLSTAKILNPNSFSIGQEWALSSGQTQYFAAGEYAITAFGGLGPPGGLANFCSSNCQKLAGPSWGIAPASFPSYAPGITPLIQNYAYFTLGGLTGSGLTNSNLRTHLSDFVFQYGTSFSEPSQNCVNCGQSNPVPEPSQIVFSLLTSVLIGFVAWHRRRIVA